MPRPIKDQVVVLTGASSGIGRATAVELGRRGASVVLAARSENALHEVAEQLEEAGGHAEVVPTDVADWPQVERLAHVAAERFGRIDTWINDAGVSTYATVEDATVEEIDRVLQVNLHGAIYGMKAVWPVMKRQGEGVIVNVASVLGKMSVPLQAAYCASKHGLIGFADALRIEAHRSGTHIEVCTVLPGATDTPFFAHARSKLGGVLPQPTPPAYDAAAVAAAIISVCEHPRREVVVGLAGKSLILMKQFSPHLADWLMTAGDAGVKLQTSRRADDGTDNLFQHSTGPMTVNGGWGRLSVGASPYTRLVEQQNPVMKAAVVGMAALGAAWCLGYFRRRQRA